MYQLRQYQKDSIAQIKDNFLKGHKKILLVAPTGSGKTVVASEMIRRILQGNKKCLFVAHRRELIMQASNKLYDFGVPHGVIMADKSPDVHANVQVVSIQTFVARIDKKTFIKPDADVIFLDEAHRSVSNSFDNLLREYPNAFIIGLTATPCRSDGRGLGDVYNKIVECSSIHKLVQQGFLVPSRVVAPTLPDLSGVKITAGDYNPKQLDKKMNQAQLVGDIVQHWKLWADDRPTVVFATSIAHSKYIAQIFRDNGVAAEHVDGEMKEIKREQALTAIKQNKIKIISCCQLLSEGWDCPPISCVILARPTKSLGLFLQMVGRTLRPYKNKKDCLIIDHSGAVYSHGFPDEPRKWTLDLTKRSNRKPKTVPPIEKQPYTCIKCQTVYKPSKNAPECPMCLHVPTKKEQIVLIKQGRLVEIKKDKEKIIKASDKNKFYGQVLYYAKQKGYDVGWASWIFKEKFKHFPHTKNIAPLFPDKNVLNYIKHYNIKKAKAR
jgi:superfamily II DNA or RNA helicase